MKPAILLLIFSFNANAAGLWIDGGVKHVQCLSVAGDVESCGGSASGGGGATAVTSTDTVITASALPTGAATSAKQDTAKTVLDNILAALASVPVTGSFYQATQPVSIAATISASIANATLAVTQSGAWSVAAALAAETTKVIGTVNIAAGQTIAVTNTGTFATQATLAAETTKVIGTINLAAAQTLATVTTVGAVTAITNALPAGTNRLGSARLVDSADADLTSAKGVQTTRFVGTQNITDAGRTLYIATGSLTGVVAEGMVTMGIFRNGVALAGATTHTVTSGKTLRLTSWCLTWINRTAAAGGAFAVMRMMATGNTVVTSPSVSALNASTALATVNAGATECAQFPQGIDLSGTMTWGVSQGAIGAVAGSSITVQGYEY